LFSRRDISRASFITRLPTLTKQPPLPIEGPELRSDDVTQRVWMSLVVPEVARIPKDYILAVNWLAIDELVNACARQSRIGRESLAVIDFVTVIPQNPQITNAVCVRCPVMSAGQDSVATESSFVPHAPEARMARIARTAYLEPFGMPVRISDYRRVVIFLDDVVPCGHDVEVEAPISVMGMHLASTRIKGAGKPEPGSNATVVS
jgi:hypothetical protein